MDHMTNAFIPAEDFAGMSATDHDEDCVMHLWAGFGLGVFATLVTLAIISLVG
jgi:hypothetical protein